MVDNEEDENVLKRCIDSGDGDGRLKGFGIVLEIVDGKLDRK